MPLTLHAEVATFGTSLPLKNANQLLAQHLLLNPTTQTLEAEASALAEEGFPWQEVPGFVKRVCSWGGYAGIAGRVLKHNSVDSIADALRDAWGILEADPSGHDRALLRLNSVHGLGTPSFASKHLRFIKPELCPVFDSELHQVLPYSFDGAGYAQFSQDCLTLAKHLNKSGLAGTTHRSGGVWYASDVEASLYIHARRLRGAA
jgi:hypothetical protein